MIKSSTADPSEHPPKAVFLETAGQWDGVWLVSPTVQISWKAGNVLSQASECTRKHQQQDDKPTATCHREGSAGSCSFSLAVLLALHFKFNEKFRSTTLTWVCSSVAVCNNGTLNSVYFIVAQTPPSTLSISWAIPSDLKIFFCNLPFRVFFFCI